MISMKKRKEIAKVTGRERNKVGQHDYLQNNATICPQLF